MSAPMILVVDDVPAVRQLARRILEGAGYHVLEAADGLEALACLGQEETVDLVISDIRMPRMDGWELAARLAGQSPPIRVLLMSAYDEHCGSQSLIGPFLAKPFSADRLREGVREALGIGDMLPHTSDRQA